ncbi:MAG TPA: preprotein translocase subunit SecG [Pseudomonadales bacterium]|nr:preprotein translocase subunit SecG [Pseudomonadales bacterium]
MESIVITVHIVLAVIIIGLILIQQGKGAEAGASFGGGASQTVFGSQGTTSFLTRATALLVTAFFVTSLTLAMFARQHASGLSDIGMPSEEVQKSLEQQLLNVEEYATPELDASDVDSDMPKIDSAN